MARWLLASQKIKVSDYFGKNEWPLLVQCLLHDRQTDRQCRERERERASETERERGETERERERLASERERGREIHDATERERGRNDMREI